ncbi:MAG: 30S ribosomal protein S3 [Anaerolineae bacterium]|nr:30S ribosomal protein S3 [Anaerolineae bacterium]
MGRKVHPVGFRLKINRPWEARWFAGDEGKYRQMLHEDFAIRRYLYKELKQAAISRIDIDRYPTQLVVTIHTAKPGIVIGRKGDAVKKVRIGLEDLTQKKVKVEVEEITKPDLDAKLVAENIAGQIERRISHSRAIKRAIAQAFRAGALGVKVIASGRLAGAEMGRREGAMEGRVPRNTLRSAMDYGTAEALTTFGRIGVKVWIYTGEKVQEEEKPEPTDVYVSQ